MANKISLQPLEKEFIYRFDESSGKATIYTCVSKWITTLDKLCKKYPNTYKLIKEDEYSKTYESSNKNLFSLRAPREKKELTEEQKLRYKAAGERLAQCRIKSKV